MVRNILIAAVLAAQAPSVFGKGGKDDAMDLANQWGKACAKMLSPVAEAKEDSPEKTAAQTILAELKAAEDALEEKVGKIPEDDAEGEKAFKSVAAEVEKFKTDTLKDKDPAKVGDF